MERAERAFTVATAPRVKRHASVLCNQRADGAAVDRRELGNIRQRRQWIVGNAAIAPPIREPCHLAELLLVAERVEQFGQRLLAFAAQKIINRRAAAHKLLVGNGGEDSPGAYRRLGKHPSDCLDIPNGRARRGLSGHGDADEVWPKGLKDKQRTSQVALIKRIVQLNGAVAGSFKHGNKRREAQVLPPVAKVERRRGRAGLD